MKYDGIHPQERLTQACNGAIEDLQRRGDDEDTLERTADNLATQAAYVRDQLADRAAPWRQDGAQRTKAKITRAIRKALGYSYP